MLRRFALMLLSLMMLASAVGARAATLPSSVLHETREYDVHLPASYAWATDRRYPLLLVLDGPAHREHTIATTDFYAAHGQLPEMIVVTLASTVRVRDFTQTDWPEMWVGGGGAANFRRFLADELLPILDRDLRTDGFRMLSGHSAGAQFVLHMLAAEPGVFDAYLALDPSLDWDERLPARELAQQLPRAGRPPALLYVAQSEATGQPFADWTELLGVLAGAPATLRTQSHYWPGETHGSLPLPAQIDGLRWIHDGWLLHPDRLDDGIAHAEAHYAAMSARLGYPVPVPESALNQLGYRELEKGHADAAIALFRRAVAENRESANAHDSLAEALAKAGRRDEAATVAARAAALAAKHDLPNRAYFDEQAQRLAEPAQP